jgi:hypothetical protein
LRQEAFPSNTFRDVYIFAIEAATVTIVTTCHPDDAFHVWPEMTPDDPSSRFFLATTLDLSLIAP